MAVQGAFILMKALRLPLEEQADREGGEAVTLTLLPEVQAFKAVQTARAGEGLAAVAIPLGEVGVVLGR